MCSRVVGGRRSGSFLLSLVVLVFALLVFSSVVLVDVESFGLFRYDGSERARREQLRSDDANGEKNANDNDERRERVLSKDERETNERYREKVARMFTHAYDGYVEHAFPSDELKPISKSGAESLQTLGAGEEEEKYFARGYEGVGLSLIESLGTLVVLGKVEQFTSGCDWIAEHFLERLRKATEEDELTVNAFEMNIRVLGGLLSGHFLAAGGGNDEAWRGRMKREYDFHGSGRRRGDEHYVDVDEDYYEDVKDEDDDEFGGKIDELCIGKIGNEGMYQNGKMPKYDGALLEAAHVVGELLLKAFDEAKEDDRNKINGKVTIKTTKLPYGWVNLKSGPIPGKSETNVAAIGTLALEFGTLSKLTGDAKFEIKAKEAMLDLWSRRNSRTNLLGSIIDVETGKWIDPVGGIGANGDSFYEYALKAYLMFGDEDYLDIFIQSYKAIMKYYFDEPGWYNDAEMNTGDERHYQLTALQNFWPGVQALIGDTERARSTQALMMNVWVKYGMSPERYMYTEDILHSTERGYMLRPELSESTAIMYKITRDKRYLRDGRIIVEDLNRYTKVPGGWAAIEDAMTKKKIDYMPSYFLSETLKYLYLLFSDFEFLKGKEVVFTTEGHILPAYEKCNTKRNGIMNNIVERRAKEVGIRLGFFEKEEEIEEKIVKPVKIVEKRRQYPDFFEWSDVDVDEASEESFAEEKRDEQLRNSYEEAKDEEKDKIKTWRDAILNHIEEQQKQVRLKQQQQREEEKRQRERERSNEHRESFSPQFLNRQDIKSRFKKSRGGDSACHVLDEYDDHRCTMIVECGVDAKTCAQRSCDSSSGFCIS